MDVFLQYFLKASVVHFLSIYCNGVMGQLYRVEAALHSMYLLPTACSTLRKSSQNIAQSESTLMEPYVLVISQPYLPNAVK